MGDKTVCFQVNDIKCDFWNELTEKVSRKYKNKSGEWEERNLQGYLRQLIYKVSKLTKEEINQIIDDNIIIKLEESKT